MYAFTNALHLPPRLLLGTKPQTCSNAPKVLSCFHSIAKDVTAWYSASLVTDTKAWLMAPEQRALRNSVVKPLEFNQLPEEEAENQSKSSISVLWIGDGTTLPIEDLLSGYKEDWVENGLKSALEPMPVEYKSDCVPGRMVYIPITGDQDLSANLGQYSGMRVMYEHFKSGKCFDYAVLQLGLYDLTLRRHDNCETVCNEMEILVSLVREWGAVPIIVGLALKNATDKHVCKDVLVYGLREGENRISLLNKHYQILAESMQVGYFNPEELGYPLGEGKKVMSLEQSFTLGYRIGKVIRRRHRAERKD